MVWLLILIVGFIAIVFSSTTAASRRSERLDGETSSQDYPYRGKRQLADNEVDEGVPVHSDKLQTQLNAVTNLTHTIDSRVIVLNGIVEMHFNKLHALEKLINEKLHSQREAVTDFTDKTDSRITTLSERLMRSEEQMLSHTLQVMSHTLRVSSQNFGGVLDNLSTENTLDEFNSQLYAIAQCDICAIQDLNVPQSRWDEKRTSITEIFKPILQKRGHYLVLRSFSSIKNKTKNHDIGYVAFGFYINPSFNFQFNIETDVEILSTNDGTGVLLIHGILFDEYTAVFGCVRGQAAATGAAENYNDEENIRLITRAVERITEIRPHFYTLIGDFKLRHTVFVHAINALWRPKLGDMVAESDVLSSGSLLSSFDKQGYAQPDHVLTNMHILDFRLFQASRVNRMRLDSVLYPLKQSMTR